ncbi:MAG: GGDEF domain-containing protein [Arenimonas sp.]
MGAKASLRLQQEVADTYRLAFVGGYFYFSAWLVVAYYGKAFVHSPIIAWSITIIFAVLAVLRGVHRVPVNKLDQHTQILWLRLHWCIVVATTTLFGIVFTWVMLDDRLAAGHVVCLLAVMGLSVAVAHAFSMRFGFAVVGVAMLYLPGLIALWVSPRDPASAWMMSIYFTYVCVALWRSNADYQHHLDVDQQLRDQRDLFEQQGRTDALTELANRRFFTETLMSMSQNAKSCDTELALMVLDLDHFKNINDQYGHAVGDACLSIFASRLKTKFGNEDEHAARLGGEEFGVLLQGHSLGAAMTRAEDFRQLCVSEPIQVGDVFLPMTVSIGVAAFNAKNHRDGDGLYRAADTAVYHAKNSGRNKVCSHEPDLA